MTKTLYIDSEGRAGSYVKTKSVPADPDMCIIEYVPMGAFYGSAETTPIPIEHVHFKRPPSGDDPKPDALCIALVSDDGGIFSDILGDMKKKLDEANKRARKYELSASASSKEARELRKGAQEVVSQSDQISKGRKRSAPYFSGDEGFEIR